MHGSVKSTQVQYKEQRQQLTFSPIRTGWIPKNGLMAIAGTMGAPSSAGRGAMQTPPVSGGGQKHHAAVRLSQRTLLMRSMLSTPRHHQMASEVASDCSFNFL